MIVKLVSKNFDIPEAYTLPVARENGRYVSLEKLFSMSPDEVTSEVEKSGLRGKGGGGAHTGEKWRLIPKNSAKPVYLVINAMRENQAPLKTARFWSLTRICSLRASSVLPTPLARTMPMFTFVVSTFFG